MTRELICGWALDERDPDAPVELVVLDNGMPLARILANRFRSDLATALPGNGRHAFEVSIPGGLCPRTRHVISVRRSLDGSDLANSPAVIEAAGSFDHLAKAAIADAVSAATTRSDVQSVLSFITAQTDRLRQRQADIDTRRNQRLTQRLMHRRAAPPSRAAGPPAAPMASGAGSTWPHILVIAEQVPAACQAVPLPTIVSHMIGMLALDCAVTFVAAGRLRPTGQEFAPLLDRGISCCRAPVYTSVEDVLRRQGDCIDLVYMYGTDIAARYATLARAHSPRAQIIYSLPELLHARLEQQAVTESCRGLLAASRRLRLAECTAAWSADAVVTQSSADASLLRRAVPHARIHVVAPDFAPTSPARSAAGLFFIADMIRARRLSVPRSGAGTASAYEADRA